MSSIAQLRHLRHRWRAAFPPLLSAPLTANSAARGAHHQPLCTFATCAAKSSRTTNVDSGTLASPLQCLRRTYAVKAGGKPQQPAKATGKTRKVEKGVPLDPSTVFLSPEALERIKPVAQKAAEQEAAGPSFFWVALMWAFGSLTFGAMSMSFDDVPDRVENLLDNPQRTREKILAKSMDLLEKQLTNFAECAEFSDAVKNMIGNDDFYVNTLLTYLTHPAMTVEARNLSSRILEVCTRLGSVKGSLVERGFLPKIMAVAEDDSTSLYVKKQLGGVLVNLASDEKNRVALGKEGAVSLLNAYYNHKFLKRRSQDVALERISAACAAVPVQDRWPDKIPGDWDLIEKYAAMDAASREKRFYEIRASLLESGVLMYFHTAAGGLVWGLFESLRAKQPLPEVIKYGLRTSLVTCLVPIYFVGASVTLYNHLRKQCADSFDVFMLNSGTAMSLLPWYYLLPIVERYSPYWIGGHVVGFVSFFSWLVYTSADSMKNDNELKRRDELYRKWKERQERVPASAQAGAAAAAPQS